MLNHIKSLLIIIISAYLGLLIVAYFFSNSLIFVPPRVRNENAINFIKLRTADGKKIAAYYLPNKDAKYTLLVSHGNAEDIDRMLPFLKWMHSAGYAVFCYDYHGYGLSEGKPTEKNSYLDIDAAYNYLTKKLHVAPKQIILYGRSLGAAIALDLAIRKPVAGVILQSAFVTAFRVMTWFKILPFDKFDNLTKIKQLKVPLLMIHGTRDRIVPFWHGKKLYRNAQSVRAKKFQVIENAGHNDIEYLLQEKYWTMISNFIKQRDHLVLH